MASVGALGEAAGIFSEDLLLGVVLLCKEGGVEFEGLASRVISFCDGSDPGEDSLGLGNG